ncbi:MAG: PQQ-binding-like beta-propeller repeat protein, partial [Actinomycetota bacterium]|nr:PQQ-binding-like beta-propeller repeat protein [Actinomycetota bacterium]
MNDELQTPDDNETPAPKKWWRQPRKLLPVLGVLLVLIAAVGAIAYSELKRPEDVKNSSVPFVEPPAKEKKPKRAKKSNTVAWPTFRYDRQRTGYLPVKGIVPPFKRLWKYGDEPLLEFPPAVVDGVLYFVDNDGYAFALKSKTGKKVWKKRIARLNAATPTYADGRLYIVNMRPGQVLALNAKTGKEIWKKSLPCRSESSPIVVHKRVYFGCEDGNLYAVKAKNGKAIWTTGVLGA